MRKIDAGHRLADLTAHQATEDELRRTQQYLRAILDNEPECVKLLDRDGLLLEMNAAGLAMIGAASLDEVQGLCVFDLVVPEHRDQFRAMHERVCAGGRETLEFEIVGIHGERRWLETHAVCLARDRPPTPAHLAITRDITHRVQLEEQLRQSQKMEAVGQLAGGIAHDFNNLLTVISGCSEVLLRDPSDHEAGRQTLGEIIEAVRRASSLTQQLLAFSRKQAATPVTLDLNGVVRSVQSMLLRLLGDTIALETALASALPPIRADLGQIEQVLVNLVVNARDAMPRGGRLNITTDLVDGQGLRRRRLSESVHAPWVRLSVTDTGCGMDESIRARIFEPFFTTKPPGEGTGLGLALVFGIVQQSGGWIEVESQVGSGSRFDVYFPAVAHSRLAPQTDQANVV